MSGDNTEAITGMRRLVAEPAHAAIANAKPAATKPATWRE